MAEVSTPQEFVCPITQEMMTEPVFTVDGQTYERSTIEQWFAMGHTSSPLTGLPLRNTVLAPNFALKHAIETYQKDRPNMEAMAHQVKDLQACLAACERELQRANARAAASVPNAEYALLLKRNQRSDGASSDSTSAEASDGPASDTDTQLLPEYDDVVAAYKLKLQHEAIMAEQASAQALLEQEDLEHKIEECKGSITDTEDEAAKEELRTVVQRGQMDALHKVLLQKEAERDAIGAQVMGHMKPVGMDGRAMLTAIRANPVATWSGPLRAAYAELHCECLALASEKHHAHEAALAAEKAGMELRIIAQGMKAKLEDLQARWQDVDARVKAAELEAKSASEAVADFSEDDAKAKALWSERVSLQPTAENLQNLAALHSKCHASLRSVRGTLASQLKQDGKSASDLKSVGLTAGELKDGSYTAGEMKDGSYTAGELKDGGYAAGELKDGGYAAGELKDVGFTLDQLAEAGFTAAPLKEVGFTAAPLKEVGFTAAQLKEAGFAAVELKDVGFTLDQLKEGGFAAAQLKEGGFTAAQLKEGGFTAAQLKECGVAAIACRDVGYGAPDLFHLCTPLDQLKEGLHIVTLQGFGCLTARDNDNNYPWYAGSLWPCCHDDAKSNDAVKQIARHLQW